MRVGRWVDFKNVEQNQTHPLAPSLGKRGGTKKTIEDIFK
jgi:hypothetical protein